MILVLLISVIFVLVVIIISYDIFKVRKLNPNVHFYVARDKDGEVGLYIGKAIREVCVVNNSKHSITLVSSEDFPQYGLNEHDYDYLKWEDEPVEVFLNLGD